MRHQRLSRRRLLVSTALTSAAIGLRRRAARGATPSVVAADLVDEAATFGRGTLDGVTLVRQEPGPAVMAMSGTGTFVSAPLESPFSLTHVGLHWQGSTLSADTCGVELRTSVDGAAWTPWRPVRVDCIPTETPTGEYFGPLLSAPGARFVQYQVHLRRGGITPTTVPRLRRMTATVIAAQPAPLGTRLRTVPVDDRDSGRTIQVTPRELWLSDNRLRFNADGSKIWPEMFVPTKKLVVHHTETRNDYATIDEAAAEVRAIEYFHAVTRAWGDIGYTALIDKFGNLYEGRHGRGEGVSREMLSPGVVAGHDLHHNYGSAGVALLGDATKADWPMPQASGPMWDALVRYGTFEAARSFIMPLAPGAKQGKAGPAPAASDFLRSDDAWSEGMRNISGHRETNDTTCPGDAVMDLLDDLRTAIDRGLADVSRTGVRVTAPGRDARTGEDLTVTCVAEPPEEGWSLTGYEYCLEGWVRLPNSEDIVYLSGFGGGPQPHQEWTRLDAPATSFALAFTPFAAGHYTVHVRAVLRHGAGKAAVERRSAYAGRHTFLVTDPTPTAST